MLLLFYDYGRRVKSLPLTQVKATYSRFKHELSSVLISLVVPKHARLVDLIKEESYELKIEDGKDLLFNIGQDVIKGKLCLKYVDRDNRREIAMKYDVHLPFAEHMEGTTALCPTELNSESGFTSAELDTIPVLASSEPHSQKEEEHELLLKFLHDFCRDGDKVVIETYYDHSHDSRGVSKPQNLIAKSSQYHLSVTFLKVLDLVGSIDPGKLTAAAELFIKIPIAGRVRIGNLQGSLTSGIKININAVIAKGSVTLGADKNAQGKHALFVDLNLDVKGIGKIGSGGKKLNLLTLPF
ncbi:hypothetical protein OG21DRAFT_1512767 [Imleria badia]|nr:hypothetical protein OG21DRAFT_1512767 [Imleria badia]